MSSVDEQAAFIAHDPSHHARVLAGPGTGKSYTAVRYLERLSAQMPDLRTRMLTFTRAATAEFADKLGDADLKGLGVAPPATVHAFALGILGRLPAPGIPMPLRLPDSWEAERLIRPDLSRRMRNAGHEAATPTAVRQLEEEMSAGWESLDPDRLLQSDLDPTLAAAFAGHWREHREAFGYVLVGELPYQAGLALEDHQPDLELDLLLVDEYQDLNEADINLIRLVAGSGVVVIAIGDDDQSIYGFRMAAPHGIRRFLEEFDTSFDYPLSTSRRCGGAILEAARTLIESDPSRPAKVPLTPAANAADGIYRYLRFASNQAEVRGVAGLISARLDAGVRPDDIAVLVRSNLSHWCLELRSALGEYGIELASTEWVTDGLKDEELRRGLAIAHLALDTSDSLAWRALLELTSGVGPTFIDYVLSHRASGERFGECLLRLHAEGFVGGPASSRTASATINHTIVLVKDLDTEGSDLGEFAWGGWVLDHLNRSALGDQATRLLFEVGALVPPSDGLGGLLASLEPMGKDLAARTPGCVRAMTMAQSKGLTVDTAIVMGVEEGIVPLPPPRGEFDEERRLLYVAMTRATDACYLTWAGQRTGPSARFGTPNVQRSRSRSPLLRELPNDVGRWVDGDRFLVDGEP